MTSTPLAVAENRLAQFNRDREAILAEVEQRVTRRVMRKATQPGQLELAINDVYFHEIRRHDAAGDADAAHEWKERSRALLGLDAEAQKAELHRLVQALGRDIVGQFDPRVYKFASGVAPSALGLLFSPISHWRQGPHVLRELDARITVDGELDLLRRCAQHGTLVFTPTHSSNMDSPVIGLALVRAQLPPVTYGAGKNLFTNPFISFFMRNLGAYRVDRRLKFELYKEVLKEYSTVLIENGYHSLFFPGGTRCRSNIVEANLKLGLMGTALTAYKNQLRQHGQARPIFVVPVTINYRLVLEAQTLMDDYLAEVGKNRFIITDDEFSRLGRIFEFMRKIAVHEGSVVVRMGRPFDVFGNVVDDAGQSRDVAGRVVDPATFVSNREGQVVDDDQRDAEYTRRLGRQIAAAYPGLTVFHTTHLLARVVFDAVAENAGTRDVYRLLRAPLGKLEVALGDVEAGITRLVEALRQQPERGALHPRLTHTPPAAIIEDAVRGLSTYHTHPIVSVQGNILQVADMKLLAYYANRMHHVPVVRRPT